MSEAWKIEDPNFDPNNTHEKEVFDDKIFRFWLKRNTKTEIIFLSDEPLKLYEHNPKIDGSWKTQTTCTNEHNCPLCNAGVKKYFAAIYPIIDCTEFESNGKKYQNTFKVFVAKKQIYSRLMVINQEIIEDKKKSDGIKNVRFHISRSEEELAPATGDIFYPKGSAVKLVDSWLENNKIPDLNEYFKPDIKHLEHLAAKIVYV